MKIKVLYHNHCFDGLASAAVFSRLSKEIEDPHASITYQGLSYGKQPDPETLFDADRHAVVDFQYIASDQLNWFFDHHKSGLATTQDEAHFRADQSGKKFFDPTYSSCTKLIADIARDRFDCSFSNLEELIHWADLIDSAAYATARDALDYEPPAQALNLIIQSGQAGNIHSLIINLLQEQTLAQVAGHEKVQELVQPMLERHRQTFEVVRQKARYAEGVVWFDVLDENLHGYSKFLGYALYPEAMYSVDLSKNPSRTKVTVGFNPWSVRERTCDISAICERYQGGGHPYVGAFPIPSDNPDQARKMFMEAIQELQSSFMANTTQQ